MLISVTPHPQSTFLMIGNIPIKYLQKLITKKKLNEQKKGDRNLHQKYQNK